MMVRICSVKNSRWVLKMRCQCEHSVRGFLSHYLREWREQQSVRGLVSVVPQGIPSDNCRKIPSWNFRIYIIPLRGGFIHHYPHHQHHTHKPQSIDKSDTIITITIKCTFGGEQRRNNAGRARTDRRAESSREGSAPHCCILLYQRRRRPWQGEQNAASSVQKKAKTDPFAETATSTAASTPITSS